MDKHAARSGTRRKLLGLLGTVPILTVAGCGGSGEPEAPTASQARETPPGEAETGGAGAGQPAGEPAAQRAQESVEQAAEDVRQAMDEAGETAEEMVDEATEAMDEAAGEVAETAGELPRLSESDPTAQALGYRHDADDVDLERFPQRGTAEAANHKCLNCALYQGTADSRWGGCPIFPGKVVNANGWCSSYVAKA